LTPSAVAEVAAELGIPTIKANRVDDSVRAEIQATGADLGVIVAFGALLDQEALDALPKGWINLHYSLLPHYRGAAPVQRAILEGATETGVTLFKIDEGLDTGAVVASLPVDIGPNETSDDLLGRLSLLGATLISEFLPALYAGFAELKDQTGIASYASKLTRQDGFLSFRESNDQTYNRFRAVTSEPGAWAHCDGQIFKLLDLRFGSRDLNATPGTVQLIDGKVFVQCSNGSVEIVRLQPAGKMPMTAKDWFRGLRSEVRFEPK
jgi:methionyl-tRNA formyltransferase